MVHGELDYKRLESHSAAYFVWPRCSFYSSYRIKHAHNKWHVCVHSTYATQKTEKDENNPDTVIHVLVIAFFDTITMVHRD